MSALSQKKAVFDIEYAADAINRIPSAELIHEDNFGRLVDVLRIYENRDSFLTSANYYFFTGRRGLWLCHDDDRAFLVCIHPNLDDRLVIFSPDLRAADRLRAFVEQNKLGPSVMIGRVAADMAAQVALDIGGDCANETCLDWGYPVHICEIDALLKLQGNDYMYIRNRLRQLDKQKVSTCKLDVLQHSRSMERMLHEWVSARAQSPEQYDDLYSPYENLFAWALNKKSDLDGVLVFVNDRLEGVGMWDVSNVHAKTANLYVNLCNTLIKGLSECVIHKSAEYASKAGALFLNMGGSETVGLNNFKKKFAPLYSLSLQSVELRTKQSREQYGSFKAHA